LKKGRKEHRRRTEGSIGFFMSMASRKQEGGGGKEAGMDTSDGESFWENQTKKKRSEENTHERNHQRRSTHSRAWLLVEIKAKEAPFHNLV